MTQAIVVKSLEDLGEFSHLFVADTQPDSGSRALVPMPSEPEADIEALANAAAQAAQELCELAVADREARRQAEEAFAEYRRLGTAIARLQGLARETQAIAEQARALADKAFDEECRERAIAVSLTAQQIAETASRQACTGKMGRTLLANRPDVVRLLAEERAQEETLRREEEERQRRSHLEEVIALAETLVAEGKINEAERTLGCLSKEHPNDPTLASRIETVRRRAWAVKTGQAEKALRQARSLHRKEPRQALQILEPLDLEGMPEPLVRQVYGCWLQACRRLKINGAMHYAPSFGRGAVLVAVEGERLEVVASIGMTRWQPGRRFSTTALRGARPLG